MPHRGRWQKSGGILGSPVTGYLQIEHVWVPEVVTAGSCNASGKGPVEWHYFETEN